MNLNDLQNQFENFWTTHNKTGYIQKLKDINDLFQSGVICERNNEEELISPEYLHTWYNLAFDIPYENFTKDYVELLRAKIDDINRIVTQIKNEFTKSQLNNVPLVGWIFQIISIDNPDLISGWVDTANNIMKDLYSIFENVVNTVQGLTGGLASISKFLPVIIIILLVVFGTTFIKTNKVV